MTLALVIVTVLGLTAWAALLSRHRWHEEQSALGMMSHQWISEHRADETRHRPA